MQNQFIDSKQKRQKFTINFNLTGL